MSIAVLLFAAVAAAAVLAREPVSIAAVQHEFNQVVAEARRPLPRLELRTDSGNERPTPASIPPFDPRRPGPPLFMKRPSMRSDFPSPDNGTYLPPLELGKRYAPDGRAQPLPAPSGISK